MSRITPNVNEYASDEVAMSPGPLAPGPLFVAVVLRQDREPSRRSGGDWAAFVGSDQEQVIERALVAKQKWNTALDAPYTVYVGELAFEAVEPRAYKLQAL